MFGFEQERCLFTCVLSQKDLKLKEYELKIFWFFFLILTQSQSNVENIDVHRLAKGYVQWISFTQDFEESVILRSHISQIPEILYIVSEKKQF